MSNGIRTKTNGFLSLYAESTFASFAMSRCNVGGQWQPGIPEPLAKEHLNLLAVIVEGGLAWAVH